MIRKALITDLMLEKNRNPNFLGEMMIYSSFAFLVDSYYAFGVLFTIWSTIFVSRVVLKESSNSKKEGWKQYKENSYLFLYKFFENDLINIAIYGFSVCFLLFFYQNGGLEQTIIKLKA